MNIYWHEIKANSLALLWWVIGMLGLIGASMVKYAGYVAAGESVNTLIANMPPMLQALTGAGRFDLSKASGFYGVMFLYIALLAGIHATVLGATILAKEERDHTTEFLYVKPVSRSTIITSKLLAALTMVIVFNLVTFMTSTYFVNAFGQGEDASVFIRTLMAALFVIQLLFLAFGTATSALMRKPAAAAGLASAVMLGTYILSIAIDLYDKLEPLKYLTPFKYFEASTLKPPTGHLEAGYLLLSAGLVTVMVALVYHLYRRKDLMV